MLYIILFYNEHHPSCILKTHFIIISQESTHSPSSSRSAEIFLFTGDISLVSAILTWSQSRVEGKCSLTWSHKAVWLHVKLTGESHSDHNVALIKDWVWMGQHRVYRIANLRMGQFREIWNGAMMSYMKLITAGQKSPSFLTEIAQFWWSLTHGWVLASWAVYHIVYPRSCWYYQVSTPVVLVDQPVECACARGIGDVGFTKIKWKLQHKICYFMKPPFH